MPQLPPRKIKTKRNLHNLAWHDNQKLLDLLIMSNIALKIHHSNWMTSYFKHQDLKAFIALSAEPVFKNGNEQEVVDIETQYALTLTNKDGEELFQELFTHLEEALDELSLRYGQWQLVEMAKTLNDGDGCSSCAAH